MPPMCPTVVLGLPGTAGSVKTRQQDLYLRCCELCGTSGNRVTTQDGACYGRSAKPDRFLPESAVAKLLGGWPIRAVSVPTNRYWLDRGGARQGDARASQPARNPRRFTYGGGGSFVERCDHAGVAGKRKRRRQGGGARQRGSPRADRGRRAVGSAPGGEDAARGSGDDQRLDALWEATRSGAQAGRGFYFQYAVGAWLTARVGAGLTNAVVVPEGFEDVSLEDMASGASLHVQAKSRGEGSGLFAVHEAAQHVLDAWEKHLDRAEPGSRLTVVFERGVRGETLRAARLPQRRLWMSHCRSTRSFGAA